MAFLESLAPNGQTWNVNLETAEPSLDASGFVRGPWGECMHFAVVFEMDNPSFADLRGFEEKGPAAQVTECLQARGFESAVAALQKNEEATREQLRQGKRAFVFNAARVPLAQRVEDAQQHGTLTPGRSPEAAVTGARIFDGYRETPKIRDYKDPCCALFFFFVFSVVVAGALYFGYHIPDFFRRSTIEFEATPNSRCTNLLRVGRTQGKALRQRLTEDDHRRLIGFEAGEAASASEDWSDYALPQQIPLPGLSDMVRHLHVIASNPDEGTRFAAASSTATEQFHQVVAALQPQQRRLNDRQNETYDSFSVAPDRDCERACRASEECVAFDVEVIDGMIGCTFFGRRPGTQGKPLPAPVNASEGKTSSCWRVVEAESIKSNTGEIWSFIVHLLFLILIGSASSVITAMVFVRMAAVAPLQATILGLFGFPACLVVLGVVLMVFLPFHMGLVGSLIIGGVVLVLGSLLLVCNCYSFGPFVPLTTEVVGVSALVVSARPMMFMIAIVCTLFSLFWSFAVSTGALGITALLDQRASMIPFLEQDEPVLAWANAAYFVYCLVYLWGGYISYNVAHTTFCYVYGQWYFNRCDGWEVFMGFTYATTTSLGTVALGSFVVALIRAAESLVRKLQRQGNSGDRDQNPFLLIIAAILVCILRCIGDVAEWISQYMYVQVAMKGMGFMDAARATFALATVNNLVYVCSSILVTYVSSLGTMMCGITGAVVAGGLGYLTCGATAFGATGFCGTLTVAATIFGFIGGILSGGSAVAVLNSGAVTILMCWAEQPYGLVEKSPKLAEGFAASAQVALGGAAPLPGTVGLQMEEQSSRAET